MSVKKFKLDGVNLRFKNALLCRRFRVILLASSSLQTLKNNQPALVNEERAREEASVIA